MFDIAWSELLLIAVVALIFIGPKELPAVMHTVGKALAKLRRTADDFRRQFEESMRESGYEDLQKNIHDFRALNPANQLKESIDRAIAQEYTSTPAPAAPPSPGTLTAAESGAANGHELSGASSGADPLEQIPEPNPAPAKAPFVSPESGGERVDRVA